MFVKRNGGFWTYFNVVESNFVGFKASLFDELRNLIGLNTLMLELLLGVPIQKTIVLVDFSRVPITTHLVYFDLRLILSFLFFLVPSYLKSKEKTV